MRQVLADPPEGEVPDAPDTPPARRRIGQRHATGPGQPCACVEGRSGAPCDPFRLASARAHEAEGPGRRAFALFQMARHPGHLVWILPAHAPETPMLSGLPRGVGERLILLRPTGETDLLWSVEETLRSRAVALVVAEPQQPLSLTAGRRLQLAAEAGGTTGLMLIRQGAGSNAAESRWRCAPLASMPDSTLHRWSLIKNKRGTLRDWTLHWNGASAAFDLVSPAGQRPCPAEPSP